MVVGNLCNFVRNCTYKRLKKRRNLFRSCLWWHLPFNFCL